MKKLNITAAEYQHKVRQQARARTIKFRKEQEKRGYKNLTVYLSEQFRNELERLSTEKGLNRQDAMDHIFEIYHQNTTNYVTNNATKTNHKSVETPVKTGSEAKHQTKQAKITTQSIHSRQSRPVKEVQLEIPAPMPDKSDKKSSVQKPVKPKQDIDLPDYLIDVDPNMPIEERHKIIRRLAEDFPGRKNAQTRIDLLNAAGILLGGKPWEKTKQFADQLSIARRWVKKQERKK